jgi:hypothetical protein
LGEMARSVGKIEGKRGKVGEGQLVSKEHALH